NTFTSRMFTPVLVVLSFASLLAAAPGDQRIIGGHDTPIEKVPWQVSLQLKGKHFCGGSIYNESYIITAAHCVDEYSAKYYMVRAGSSKHNSGGVLVQVAGIKYHEEFNRWSGENDVAVIRLENPLPIGDNIKPIRLAEEDPVEGSPALNTGWGVTYMGTNVTLHPENLQGVNIRIETKRNCKLVCVASWVLNDDDICAGVKGHAICYADSGGPLVVYNKLVGITSRTCEKKCSGPGLFASVAKFRGWIFNALNEV
ncbi:hypothetical protein KR074_009271, partial [Drosophila pseudoananassae]